MDILLLNNKRRNTGTLSMNKTVWRYFCNLVRKFPENKTRVFESLELFLVCVVMFLLEVVDRSDLTSDFLLQLAVVTSSCHLFTCLHCKTCFCHMYLLFVYVHRWLFLAPQYKLAEALKIPWMLNETFSLFSGSTLPGPTAIL